MAEDGTLIGGRETRPISLRHWDPNWATRFEQERAGISSALGRVARRIDHIGSTSVPGLPAKPIVDIQLTLDDVEETPRRQ